MLTKHLEDSLILMEGIGAFCVKRKATDNSGALYHVSPIFDSTDVLFRLLKDQSESLKFNIQGDSVAVDPVRQIGCIIIDQSRFTFVAIISILESTAKDISLKEGFPVKTFLDNEKPKEREKRKYLKDIMSASASEELKLITVENNEEWKFLLDIRNALVHSNAIPDKDLVCVVYGKSYFFKKGEEIMNGDIQSLFIFSKKAVELFYEWSQKHEKCVKAIMTN